MLLYDAGPRVGDFDLGERVVLPALRKLRRVDLMLLGHADADHAGGAAAVARGLPVLRVVGGKPRGCLRSSALRPVSAVSSGSGTAWCSSCGNGQMPATAAKSCVLQVQANGERLLLTGDLDREGRAGLAGHAPGGRHGLAASAPSWQPQFLVLAVCPAAAPSGADLPWARQWFRSSAPASGGALPVFAQHPL